MRAVLRAALGWTWLDDAGDWLGLERADLWHVYDGAQTPLGRRLDLAVEGRFERSPLAKLVDEGPGEPALRTTAGLTAGIGGGLHAGLLLDQNLPALGVAPDIAVRLAIGASLGSSP